MEIFVGARSAPRKFWEFASKSIRFERLPAARQVSVWMSPRKKNYTLAVTTKLRELSETYLYAHPRILTPTVTAATS